MNSRLQNILIILFLLYLPTFSSNLKINNTVANQEDSVLVEVGRWGEGPCYAVKQIGDYIAIGNGSVLQIFDFNDPFNPILIGEVLTDGLIEDMEIQGNFIYKIYPFQIIDLSNPSTPKVIYTQTIGFDDSEISVEGNYAYIGDWPGNVFIFDINNPYEPRLLSSVIASGEDVNSIVVKEPYLYVSTVASWLIDVFDISDKSNPKDTTRIWTTSVAPILKIHGNYLIEAGASHNGFKIYNLSNAPSLTLTGNIDFYNNPYEMTVVDTLVYLTGENGIMSVLNISDYYYPKIINQTQFSTQPFGISQHIIKDNRLYGAAVKGLMTIDISDIHNPNLLTTLSTSFLTRRIVAKEDYVFVASDYVGMKVIDISDSTKPKTAGEFITNSRVYDIALKDNMAFLYTDSALIAIDITNPYDPKELGRITISAYTDDFYTSLEVLNNYAATTFPDSTINIFNIINPLNITQVTKFKTASKSFNISLIERDDSLIIFSSEEDSGLFIYAYDRNNINNITKIYSLKEDLPVLGSLIKGNALYLSCNAGLNIYDITNLKSIYKLNRILLPAGTYPEMALSSNYVYVEADYHLVTIDIREPSNAYVAHDYINYNMTTFTPINNLVLLGIYSSGIQIFQNYLITDIINDYIKTIPSGDDLLQNYPNPFNPSTTISFSIPSYSQIVVKVFDILGREIQEIVNDYFHPGKHSVIFNASNLTSGVYFYQIVTNKTTKTMKMILQE